MGPARATKRARGRARGQATMELALGLLMLVGVVLVGLHLAEVSFLSLKTNEAAAQAMWEATGRRVHHFGRSHQAEGGDRIYESWNDELLSSAEGPGVRAQDRYVDFDGRTARRGGATVTQVVTQADRMRVTCEEDASVRFAMRLNGPNSPGRDPYMDDVRALLRDLYRPDVGGLRCRASADLALLNAPRRFLDGSGSGGFFQEALWGRNGLRVCSAGRAVGSTCRGGYGILLGDWSLDGPPGNEILRSTMHEDAMSGNDMQPYRSLVRKLYEANGRSRGTAASRFAEIVGGETRSPHEEQRFYMSYAGVEWDYEDWDYVDPDQYRRDKEIFDTGGGYDGYKTGYPRPAARAFPPEQRSDCYLGLPCAEDP